MLHVITLALLTHIMRPYNHHLNKILITQHIRERRKIKEEAEGDAKPIWRERREEKGKRREKTVLFCRRDLRKDSMEKGEQQYKMKR